MSTRNIHATPDRSDQSCAPEPSTLALPPRVLARGSIEYGPHFGQKRLLQTQERTRTGADDGPYTYYFAGVAAPVTLRFSRSDYYAGNRAEEFLRLNGLSGCAQIAPGMLSSIFVWVSAAIAFLP